MAYRDERHCHICGADTSATCPVCANGVCAAHTIEGLQQSLGRRERRQLRALASHLDAQTCERCADQELQRRSGPYVAVYRDSDAALVQMLAEALRGEAFDVRVLGSQNASLLGAGQHIFEQRIEVPEPQAAEAAAQIAALLGAGDPLPEDEGPLAGGDVEDAASGAAGVAVAPSSRGLGDAADDDEPEGDDEHDEEARAMRPVSPRRRSLAAGVALVFPGAAHFYLGRPVLAFWLAVAFFVGAWRGVAGPAIAALPPMLGVVLFDLVGGQLILAAVNRGERLSVTLQATEGAVVALLLVQLGQLLAGR